MLRGCYEETATVEFGLIETAELKEAVNGLQFSSYPKIPMNSNFRSLFCMSLNPKQHVHPSVPPFLHTSLQLTVMPDTRRHARVYRA